MDKSKERGRDRYSLEDMVTKILDDCVCDDCDFRPTQTQSFLATERAVSLDTLLPKVIPTRKMVLKVSI